MKNFRKTFPIIITVLSVSLMGLGGCQIFSNQTADEGDIDHAPRDRRIGVIQSLGTIKTDSQGTNLLIMDEGSTILLKSLAINLNDPKYVAKKVEVSGLLTYTTDGKQIMEVESIDVLEDAPLMTQQAAVSWRDYVNAQLGFRVKYRDDFTVDEKNQVISFTRPVSAAALMMLRDQENSSSMEIKNEHTIMISSKSHNSTETLVKDFLKLPDDNSATLLTAGYNKSRIGVSGIEAYKLVSDEGKTVTFSFEDGGKFYQVVYSGGSDSQSLEDQNIFYDFLASFELTGGSPTSPVVDDEDVDDTENNNVPATPPSAPVSDESDSDIMDPTAGDEDTTTDSPTTDTTTPPPSAPTTGGTQEALPGYSSFVSSGYKFTMQYPKSWYYGQATTTESDVIRRYDFGTKPVDEEPGTVYLDIVSGAMPSGSSSTVGDNTVVKTSSGSTVSYYYKDENGRIYRVTGPSSMDSSLKTMAGTIAEQ